MHHRCDKALENPRLQERTPVQNHLAARNNDTFYLWTTFPPRNLKPWNNITSLMLWTARGTGGGWKACFFRLWAEQQWMHRCHSVSEVWWLLVFKHTVRWRVKWLLRQNVCSKPGRRFMVPFSCISLEVLKVMAVFVFCFLFFFPEWARSEVNTFAFGPFLLPQEFQCGWRPCHQSGPPATVSSSNNLAPPAYYPYSLIDFNIFLSVTNFLRSILLTSTSIERSPIMNICQPLDDRLRHVSPGLQKPHSKSRTRVSQVAQW